MDIIIQSLGFNAGETLENFTREKLQTLKSDIIIRANVTFSLGQESTPENNYCEIILEIPGNDMFVKKTGKYFETALSECVDVLQGNLMKEKQKNIDRRQADAQTIQDELNKTSGE
ncbi:MAG: HPF/RaiA family ribosome-associated protein [Chitinophagaceae bacterium]|nr:MAG: HPF/RaiA family ribosome-associated protein [Chitinophagaceae bacterium]